MNIELGLLHDGQIMLVSDTPLPDIVRRVDYYHAQRLFMLIYGDADHPDEEMTHYEIPDDIVDYVARAPEIMIYSLFPDHEPIGYKAPLVHVKNKEDHDSLVCVL